MLVFISGKDQAAHIGRDLAEGQLRQGNENTFAGHEILAVWGGPTKL